MNQLKLKDRIQSIFNRRPSYFLSAFSDPGNQSSSILTMNNLLLCNKKLASILQSSLVIRPLLEMSLEWSYNGSLLYSKPDPLLFALSQKTFCQGPICCEVRLYFRLRFELRFFSASFRTSILFFNNIEM